MESRLNEMTTGREDRIRHVPGFYGYLVDIKGTLVSCYYNPPRKVSRYGAGVCAMVGTCGHRKHMNIHDVIKLAFPDYLQPGLPIDAMLIPGYEHYYLRPSGHVWSTRQSKPKQLNPIMHSDTGAQWVTLADANRKRTQLRVDKLVAMVFPQESIEDMM